MFRLPRSLFEVCGLVVAAVRPWPALAARFLVHYRIRISVAVLACVIVENMLSGVRPHNVTDLFNEFTVAGVGLLLLGLGLRSWAAGVLHKHDELSTRGPYRLMRHPLYFGSLAMIVGFCLLIDDYTNLGLAASFALVVYVPQIRSEERILSQRFQESWAAYANQTGLFFPRRLSCDLGADWQFSQWLWNKEYEALGAALLGLIGLKVWGMLVTG